MKRILLQAAYVLHRRPYRENSFLLEVFTREYGCLTVIAKGVRNKRSTLQGLLQPFIPLLISFAGKHDLMTLSHAEVSASAAHLQGDCLFAGFYLNELLLCLLHRWDAHAALYAAYEQTLLALQGDKLEQRILRCFEKYLLEELGYAILPRTESSLNALFSADCFYRFIPEEGFVISELDQHSARTANIFSGKSLLAFAKEDWQDEESLADARRLMRFVLAPLLGARPIHSRRLFMQPTMKEVMSNEV